MQCADELLPGRQLLVCQFSAGSSVAGRNRLPLPGMSAREGARAAEERILSLSVGVLTLAVRLKSLEVLKPLVLLCGFAGAKAPAPGRVEEEKENAETQRARRVRRHVDSRYVLVLMGCIE